MRKQDKDRNGKPEALLWLDFETTGTDRNDSLPLEVGMECTDVLADHSYGSLHRIIRPDYLDLLGMSPVAFSMHTDNGLLFELLNGSAHDDCVDAVANAVEEFSTPCRNASRWFRRARTWTSTSTSSNASTWPRTGGCPTASST